MGLTSAKVDRIAAKINKKLIGDFNDLKTMGNDLVIRKYIANSNNKFGKVQKSELTLDSEVNTKGIIIDSTNYRLIKNLDLNSFDSDFILYIKRDVVVESSTDINNRYKYVAFFKNKEYNITNVKLIGDVSNSTGMVKIISLTSKHPQN